jgi:hypothetical protein
MKFLTCALLLVLAHAARAQFDDVFSLDDALTEMRPAVLQDDAVEEPVVRARVMLFDEGDDANEEREEPVSIQTRRALRVETEEQPDEDAEILGRLSANPFATDSTSNQFSQAGSPYSPKSINNPYGQYGSEYSSQSARNPYATDAPKIYAQDGTYLGRLSENRFDPESTANPYGRYGSPYSPTSINNPYSKYGSPYSPSSPNNPYTTTAPPLFGD